MNLSLTTYEEGYREPYGDITVNLAGKAPDYCGYVDLNNMPALEKFIADNDLGGKIYRTDTKKWLL